MKTRIKILFSCALIGLCFLLAVPVFAAPNINEFTGDIAEKAGYSTSDSSDTALSEKVGGIIKIAMGFIGTIFLVLTVYAGILWMTASGNESQVEKATGIIKMSIIGLVITLAAYSITYFVVGYLVSANSSNTEVGSSSDSKSAQQSTWKSYWQGFKDQANPSNW